MPSLRIFWGKQYSEERAATLSPSLSPHYQFLCFLIIATLPLFLSQTAEKHLTENRVHKKYIELNCFDKFILRFMEQHFTSKSN